MSIANNNNNTLLSIVEPWANNELTCVGQGLTSFVKVRTKKGTAK